jgi:predicted RNase H-like HicB family nuclease
MMKTLTATIWREDDGYVSLCSEFDIASQGNTVEEARSNLREAVELFFESAHPNEISQRLSSEVYITPLEVEIEATA